MRGTTASPGRGMEGDAKVGGSSYRGPHRMAAALTCPRQWALRYHYYVRPYAEKDHQLAGTLAHDAMAYWYADKLPDDKKPAWFFAQDMHATLAEKAKHRLTLIDNAIRSLECYTHWEEDIIEPLHVEHEFAATLGSVDPEGPRPDLNDEIVTCRTDLVARISNAAGTGVYIIDHKSKGRWDSDKYGRLKTWNPDGEFSLDFQVLTNLHLVRKALEPMHVNGFMIQRLRRELPWDFDRNVLNVGRLPYAQTPRLMRLAVMAEKDAETAIEKYDDANPACAGSDKSQRIDAAFQPEFARYHACYGRWGACDYRDLCMADDTDEREALVQLNYKKPEAPTPPQTPQGGISL